jgi:hypothetical protein
MEATNSSYMIREMHELHAFDDDYSVFSRTTVKAPNVAPATVSVWNKHLHVQLGSVELL